MDKRRRHRIADHDRRDGRIPSSLSSGQVVEYWIVLLVCRLMGLVTNVWPATRLVSGGSSGFAQHGNEVYWDHLRCRAEVVSEEIGVPVLRSYLERLVDMRTLNCSIMQGTVQLPPRHMQSTCGAAPSCPSGNTLPSSLLRTPFGPVHHHFRVSSQRHVRTICRHRRSAS